MELKFKLENFAKQMQIELENNAHKGDISSLTDIATIVLELEYHKAKLLLAVRQNNRKAVKEYIADTANFLYALGDIAQLYDEEPAKEPNHHVLRENAFNYVPIDVSIPPGDITKTFINERT